MKREFRYLSVVLLVLLISSQVLLAKSSLEVKDLQVEFLSDKQVRVKGLLRCNTMEPPGLTNPWSEIVVNIDFPQGKHGFSLLPERFRGLGTTSEGRWCTPYLEFNGKRYYQAKKGQAVRNRFHGESYHNSQKDEIFYTNMSILAAHPAVIDKNLDNDKHDGQWITFDKTLEFKNIQAKGGLRYRVVIGWTLHCTTTGAFNHTYFWVVYGPFPWGVSPPCKTTLKASIRRPVFFTEKGVEIKEPVALDGKPQPGAIPEGYQPPTKEGDGKRPKLVRPTKSHTHLEAVDASILLKKKLAALPGIQGSNVGLPPKFALVSINYTAGMKPEDITRLVSRVSLETAQCAPWVEFVVITTSGDQGGSTVTIAWDPLVKYSAEEMTIQEFYKTWKIDGAPLVIPENK